MIIINWRLKKLILSQEFIDKLKSDGYDGIIIQDTTRDTKGSNKNNHYIAFESNQIKSVNNQGIFSSATGNIYYQETNNNKAGSFKKEFDKYITESMSNPTTRDVSFI